MCVALVCLGFLFGFVGTLMGESNQSGFDDSDDFRLSTIDQLLSDTRDSNSFVLDTGGEDQTTNSHFADSSIGFSLDTRGDDGETHIDFDQTGFSDSNISFVLNTTNGNGSPESNESSFADSSSGFELDTRDEVSEESSGFADSDGFRLDTGGPDGTIRSDTSDSSGFALDTRDSYLSESNQSEFDFADSGGFPLDTQGAGGNDSSPQPNQNPQIHTEANATILENELFVLDLNASDPDGDALSYSILYGDDSEFFELNASNGSLRFLNPPDFENPDDNNSDNVYELTVGVSDGHAMEYLNLSVGVLDAFENQNPQIHTEANATILENELLFVLDLNATTTVIRCVREPGDTLSYSILYGDDSEFFELNASNGSLRFLNPPDFENPDDNNSDNIYELTIGVSDGHVTEYLNLNVGVLDAFENQNPQIHTEANATILENELFVLDLNASDPDGDVLSYSILYGDDSEFFELNASNGSLRFLNPPDFENPDDNNSDNVYELTIGVSDGHAMEYLNLNVGVLDAFENQNPQIHTEANATILENELFVLDLNASDPDGDTLSYSILYGDDSEFFELNASNGSLRFLSPPDFENPDDNNSDNIYELTVGVSDGHVTEYLNLNVGVLDAFENQNPQIHTEANATILENELFVLDLNASDPDGDTLSYSILYGDDSEFFELNASNGGLRFLSPPILRTRTTTTATTFMN